MNGYEKLVQADRRLVILRILAEDAGYSHNEYVLREALKILGHSVGHDLMHTELAWLAEQGLVTVSDAAGIQVAALTARGLDVAKGTAVVPGVKRPEPEI